MPKRKQDVSPPTHPDADNRERAYLGSADDTTEAWNLAEEFAKLLRTLGVSPDCWRIGVRQVNRAMFLVEAIKQDNPEENK